MSDGPAPWRTPRGTVATVLFAILLTAGIAFILMQFMPWTGVYGARHSFPELKDWQTLRITLSRGLCLGTCPSYSIEIRGDGTAIYTGTDCVAVKGRRTATVDRRHLAALLQRFRDADYFSLKDSYVAEVTDNPSFRTSLAFDGHSKSVSDYVGHAVGMPSVVSALEDEIDKIAGSERWIYGGPRTCFGRAVDDSWRKNAAHP